MNRGLMVGYLSGLLIVAMVGTIAIATAKPKSSFNVQQYEALPNH
jgi:hypothetical protein